MATIHPYPVTVTWQGGRLGSGAIHAANSGVETPIAVPPEFQGPGGETNPEELLVSAVAGCYSITFSIIAANRKLPVEKVEVHAEGQVEQQGMNFVYKTIVLRPHIFLLPGTAEAQATAVKEMAIKADAYCIVTNAVRDKVEIRLEPEIVSG